MTTFFLMRHGLTEWNRDKRIQGQTDIPLCDEGRDMAREWARSLAGTAFDRILTSDLARAVETGELVNAGRDLPMSRDARLREQEWGRWTGLSKPELLAMRAELDRQEALGFGFQPPGGEDRETVLWRACDALLEFSETHPGDRVLVVTHSGVLKCLLYALSGMEFLPAERSPLRPYRLHRVECVDMELAPGEFNMEL